MKCFSQRALGADVGDLDGVSGFEKVKGEVIIKCRRGLEKV